MKAPSTLTNADNPFDAEAVAALGELRSTLRGLISALPSPVHRAADLQRLLGLDAVLSWRVFRIAKGDDLLGDAVHVPGPAAMGRFLRAAERRGAATKTVRAAYDSFERLIEEHAGDRVSFETMASSLSDEESRRQLDLQHRRAAYRAQSHIWGVQAETQLTCMIVNPSDEGWADVATVRGLLNVRRLRPDVGWPVTASRVTMDDAAKLVRRVAYEPIDDRGLTVHGVAPLMDFCSQPQPEFHVYEDEAEFLHADLPGSSIGNRSSVTFLLGYVTRRVGEISSETMGRTASFGVIVSLPVRALVFDVLVRRGMFAEEPPEATVEADHPNRPGVRSGDAVRKLLPMNATVTAEGSPPSALHTPDVPRYREMAEFVFGRLGWPAEEFDVWRCRIEYPVMPSILAVRFPRRMGRQAALDGA